MKDIISGLLFAVISVFFLIMSRQIRDPGFDSLGPRFLPQLVLVIILVLSLGVIWSGIRNHRAAQAQEEEADTIDVSTLAKPLLIMGLLIALTATLVSRIVPFYISGTVFALAAGALLVDWTNRRQIIALIAVSLIFPPVISFVFKSYFFVNLP